MSAEQDFTEGLFACFKDFKLCLCVWCIPCIPSAKQRGWLDGREPNIIDYCCRQPSPYVSRQSFRKRYGYKMDAWKDCLCACFCYPCFLGQNDLEMRKHGYSPDVVVSTSNMSAGAVKA
eukprot:TRINITY_DN10643_c0_g1_i1.p2 TRINITY_DN10643_c0_g1~~TRINITY_DN10643_c0_g1_i1.p2  ORF type:complete len:119 (+),score=24.24 TRINITY_DN10643_c0_g1_i1:29-385(+)